MLLRNGSYSSTIASKTVPSAKLVVRFATLKPFLRATALAHLFSNDLYISKPCSSSQSCASSSSTSSSPTSGPPRSNLLISPLTSAQSINPPSPHSPVSPHSNATVFSRYPSTISSALTSLTNICICLTPRNALSATCTLNSFVARPRHGNLRCWESGYSCCSWVVARDSVSPSGNVTVDV